MLKIFIITGNSATGKTFLINNVENISKNLMVVEKITTRNTREGEKELKHCDLRFGFSVDEVKKSDFFYSYRNEWYGINKKDIDGVLSNGKNPIFVIRCVSTILDLKKIYPNMVVTILCQSLFSRNELISFLLKNDVPIKEIDLRLSDKYEIKCHEEYQKNINIFDYIILNKYDDNFLEEARECILENIP